MRVPKRPLGLAIIALLWIAAYSVAQGQPSVSLAWDPSPDTNVIGYAVYYGNASGVYGSRVDAGLNLTVTVPGLAEGLTYYFAAVAYDAQGIESEPSNEVSYRPVAGSRQVWGRVLWAGQPVSGAHVWATFGTSLFEGWTDTNGLYNLTGLGSTNTYVISCTATGLTFAAQFTNPVSLASGDAYGQDFYANEPLPPSGSLATYTVSGQVTDSSVGVAGVEVRGGGMVTTTDSSGNYQFTNFVNGSYTLVARKDSWTFSPATRVVSVSSANSTGNNFSRAAPYSISGTFAGLPVAAQSPAPTVYLSNGRSVQATRQGSGQNRFWGYTLTNVPAGQYSMSAALTGYVIVPAGFNNPLTLSGNLSGINFTASTGTVAGAISGRITQQQGSALPGAAIKASLGGAVVASATSDSDGYYRIDNLTNGFYTVVPSKAGYSFSPSPLTANSVPATALNFTATGPAPTITTLTANPTTVSSSAGTTLLSATATGSGTLSFSWDSISAPAPVAFSTNDSSGAASTRVTFQAPGSYVFRARVTDTNASPATSNIVVVVNASAGTIVVTPYQVQLTSGQAVSFRADAWDQLGNRISVSPVWSTLGGGSIDSNGVFSATTPGGPFAVIAHSSSLAATGFVSVATSTNLVVNTAPMLASISDQTIHAGATVTITNTAIDNDSPPQILTFTIGAGAPAGATIGSTNGIFVWTSTAAQANTTNSFAVTVTDNGTPNLSDTKNFRIRVIASLAIGSISVSNGSVTISWGAIPGKTYRVQYMESLSAGTWNALAPDVTAEGTTASQVDSAGASQRFYRVLSID